MELNALTAISPLDGRYRNQLQQLDEYFSEFALIKSRVTVEVEYFLFLAQKNFFSLSSAAKKHLQSVVENFSIEDAQEIKKTERITNHDVKAVEYFLKTKLHVSGKKGKRQFLLSENRWQERQGSWFRSLSG